MLNSQDASDVTPLSLAVRSGHYEASRLLMNAHVDVNLKNEWGEAPLHIAARGGCVVVINNLIKQHHYEVDDHERKNLVQDIPNESIEKRRGVVQLLLKSHAEINQQNLWGGNTATSFNQKGPF